MSTTKKTKETKPKKSERLEVETDSKAGISIPNLSGLAGILVNRPGEDGKAPPR